MTSSVTALIDRRATYINRWHHRPARQVESVAEHQWSTAYVAWILAEALVDREWAISVDAVIQMAMLHDMTEIVTGDMPGPFKVRTAGQWQVWEDDAVAELWPDLDQRLAARLRRRTRGLGLMPRETALVKFADKVSALAFALQELDQGNTLFYGICGDAARRALEIAEASDWWPAVCEAFDGLETLLRDNAAHEGSG